MSDDTTPKFKMVEMRADEAPRNFEVELSFALGQIEAMKSQMVEMESFNSQLQDTFRLNVAATLLGTLMLGADDDDDDELIMARAITLADKFLAHYITIMQKNAAEYARRITEAKANEEQAPPSESVN